MRHRRWQQLALLSLGLVLATEAQAISIIPAPLAQPVLVQLEVDPVVMIGPRLIDFSPNLAQEFITFFALIDLNDFGYRMTLGLRARDGLASLVGTFPPSPDPAFVNVLPDFTPGTTALLFFDVAAFGENVKFPITITDLQGDARTAEFQTPTPEPTTLLLWGTGAAGLGVARWVKRRRSA
jgi:hypothetical protein